MKTSAQIDQIPWRFQAKTLVIFIFKISKTGVDF